MILGLILIILLIILMIVIILEIRFDSEDLVFDDKTVTIWFLYYNWNHSRKRIMLC